MRVVAANLCHRFYLDDGWSREQVAEMLESGDITMVLPRWEDWKKDQVLQTKMSAPADFNCADADYFAVYNTREQFCEEKLAKHEIIRPGFGGPALDANGNEYVVN